jgi:hypothetical protein
MSASSKAKDRRQYYPALRGLFGILGLLFVPDAGRGSEQSSQLR